MIWTAPLMRVAFEMTRWNATPEQSAAVAKILGMEGEVRMTNDEGLRGWF